jgi:PadR family transcriptional regulator PadR
LQTLCFFVNIEEMTRRNSTGNLDLITMLVLIRLDEEAYGVSISREIKQTIGQEIALGTIYAVLERLERNGLASSTLGESTPERGGRAKRYFRITAKGLREVNRLRRAFGKLWQGVPEFAARKA